MFPFIEATSKGVRPFLSLASNLALASIKAWTISVSPVIEASCNGVFPLLSIAFTSAPFSINNLATSSFLFTTASSFWLVQVGKMETI